MDLQREKEELNKEICKMRKEWTEIYQGIYKLSILILKASTYLLI